MKDVRSTNHAGLLTAVTVMCAAVSIGGCDLITSEDCETIGLAALNVTVVDSVTQQVIDGEGVTIVARDGSYVDSLTLKNANLGAFAGARNGARR